MNNEKELLIEDVVFDVEKINDLEDVEEVITPSVGTVFCCTS